MRPGALTVWLTPTPLGVTLSRGPERSPSEQYADFRRGREHPVYRDFAGLYAFPLDDFQVRACHEIEEGRGVLVAAPTGSGKTVVGEFAMHLALATGRKCFYTTPIKALSQPEVQRPRRARTAPTRSAC